MTVNRFTSGMAGRRRSGVSREWATMLGLYEDVRPRFVKRYAELGEAMRQAAEAFGREVRDGSFPGAEHEFK